METLMQDLRYAFRTLLKNPGFSFVAVLVLALGIGANSAIYTVVNAVLLRPLPYPDSGRLVQVYRQFKTGVSEAVSATKFLYWKEHGQSFEFLAAYDVLGGGMNLTEVDQSERVSAIRVSPEFFRVLGVGPRVGRDLQAQDGLPGARRVAVISDGLWRRRFGADARIIGRPIRLSGEDHLVVGVMPRNFKFENPVDVWTVLRLEPGAEDNSNMYLVLGRLRAGATLGSARGDVAALGERFRSDYPKLMEGQEAVGVRPYLEFVVGEVRPALMILLGAVALVLLIACANVANLLLARGISRTREIVLRAVVGAGRWRIARQLLTESLMLSLLGGAAGLLLGWWGLKILQAFNPVDLPRLNETGLDGSVLLYTLALSLATGALFGLGPAFQAVRLDLQEALKEGGSRSTAGAQRQRLRGSLLVGEFALALMLLIGSALLVQSLLRIQRVEPGIDPRNVLTMKMSLGGSGYGTTAAVDDLLHRVIQRIESLPGVGAAAAVSSLPFELGPDSGFHIPGRPRDEEVSAQIRVATPHYFKAMRMPVIRGRGIEDTDTMGSLRVMVINETLARRLFQGADPLGKELVMGGDPAGELGETPRQIVGSVGDSREQGLDQPVPPTVFIPFAQLPDPLMAIFSKILPTCLVVRTAGEPTGYSTAIQAELSAVDRRQPVSDVRSMERIIAESIGRRRFNALLLTIFAIVALVLAAAGIYGILSYSVSQRSNEIGIRMALGATRAGALRLVMREAMVLAGVGVALGLAGALLLTRVLSGFLFGVRATDPLTLAGTSLFLMTVAAVSSFLPALRATTVDPATALRSE
jgi:putative ABC transport system permease protein